MIIFIKGKTFQVITLVHTILRNIEKIGIRRVLILCPVGIIATWKTEFKLWLKKCDSIKVSAV